MNSPFVNSSRSHQRGVALITCLLVFAIATALVSQIVLRSQANLQKTQWLIDQAQAREDALLTEQLALATLARARRDNSLEQLLPDSAQHRTPADVQTEFSHSQWRLSDLQARINLNNLLNDGALASQTRRFLQQQGIEQSFADSIKDWVDGDTQPTGLGAEDGFYEARKTPHVSANQKLLEVDALRGIAGFDSKRVMPVLPLLTALPQATAININTAPVSVLAAVHQELKAEDTIRARQQLPGGFSSVDSFIETQLPEGIDIDNQALTISSSYYQLDIITRYQSPGGERHFTLQTQLSLDESGFQILGRSFGKPNEAAATATKSSGDSGSDRTGNTQA